MQIIGQQPAFRHAGAGAFSVVLALCLSLSCADTPEASSPPRAQRVAEGKRLMQQYCSTCHLPVPAASLDEETWLKHVLPVMAPRLGVGVYRKKYYPKQNVSSGSAIPFSDWKKIVEYFETVAPVSLRVPNAPAPFHRDTPLFSVQKPRWDSSRHTIATTAMVAFDPFTRHIYSSDITAHTIYRWNENLEPVAINRSSLSVVDVSFVKDSTGDEHAVFTSIGTMRAVNVANGSIRDINLLNDSSRVMAINLPRPVCSLPGDFNNDERRDWVVCGFGHTIGGLYALVQQADHTYEKRIIRNVPGAIAARAGDFNHDGWLDAMVLFAHGDEGIWMFTNNQKGGFKAENVLRFPPVYGSTSFQLADFNDDGAPDILYTSGDNADYSDILKPYHGIYLFLNQGDYRYEQAYFHHLNGATKAIAADFDEDGDLDISAIAFFADLSEDFPRTFVYLEQVERLQFSRYAPRIERYGRWISMDAGDYDGDTDLDLVLGNYSKAVLRQNRIETEWDAYTPFIVLENETR